jgi:hypothetical protein
VIRPAGLIGRSAQFGSTLLKFMSADIESTFELIEKPLAAAVMSALA